MAVSYSSQEILIRLRKTLNEADAAVKSSQFMLQSSRRLILRSKFRVAQTRSHMAESDATKLPVTEWTHAGWQVWEAVEVSTGF